MSWEEASLRTHLLSSKLPEYSEAARREVDSLRACIEALQDQRTGPRSLQEAKFMLSQVQAQGERCKRAIGLLKGCQPNGEKEGEAKRRLIASLSVALDEHMGSLQQDIQQDSSDYLQASQHLSSTSLEWEDEFRRELLADQGAIEKNLSELRTLLCSAATTVKSQGEQLDRLDLSISLASENVQKGAEELEKTEQSQQGQSKKLVAVFVIVSILIVVLVLVLVLREN